MEHFKQMQADIKEFSTLEVESGREAKILSNIKTALADYLHSNMLAFKGIKAVSNILRELILFILTLDVV